MDLRKLRLVFVGLLLAVCLSPPLLASGHSQLWSARWQLDRFYAAVADGDYAEAAEYSAATEGQIARWAALAGKRHGRIIGMRIHRAYTEEFVGAQGYFLFRVRYVDGTEESNGLIVPHGERLPLPGPTIEERIQAEYAARRPWPTRLEFVGARVLPTQWEVRYVVTWPDGRREERTEYATHAKDIYIRP